MKFPDRLVLLRYTGSIVLVFGYFVLLNVDVFWGVCLRIVANCLSFPWALKHKVWDFVALLVFFLILEVAKLIELVSS